MQFLVNVILYGKTLVKSALLLDIRKNTAYAHNAALSVVRLTSVLSYKSQGGLCIAKRVGTDLHQMVQIRSERVFKDLL